MSRRRIHQHEQNLKEGSWKSMVIFWGLVGLVIIIVYYLIGLEYALTVFFLALSGFALWRWCELRNEE